MQRRNPMRFLLSSFDNLLKFGEVGVLRYAVQGYGEILTNGDCR